MVSMTGEKEAVISVEMIKGRGCSCHNNGIANERFVEERFEPSIPCAPEARALCDSVLFPLVTPKAPITHLFKQQPAG
jgi:hypothetical protein